MVDVTAYHETSAGAFIPRYLGNQVHVFRIWWPKMSLKIYVIAVKRRQFTMGLGDSATSAWWTRHLRWLRRGPFTFDGQQFHWVTVSSSHFDCHGLSRLNISPICCPCLSASYLFIGKFQCQSAPPVISTKNKSVRFNQITAPMNYQETDRVFSATVTRFSSKFLLLFSIKRRTLKCK